MSMLRCATRRDARCGRARPTARCCSSSCRRAATTSSPASRAGNRKSASRSGRGAVAWSRFSGEPLLGGLSQKRAEQRLAAAGWPWSPCRLARLRGLLRPRFFPAVLGFAPGTLLRLAAAVGPLLRRAMGSLLLLRPAVRVPLLRLAEIFRRRSRLEARYDAALDLAVNEALDCCEQRPVFGADQRNRLALDAGAAGAADTVHVILGDVRQV